MDFNAIIKRVINLITKTNEEWDAIQGESLTIKDIYLKFAIILYAIPSVALFIGWLIGGVPFSMAIVMAIFLYAITLGVLFLMGLLVDVLAPAFGGTKDMANSQKLAVFSMVPYAVIGALFILPIGGGFGFGGGLFYLIMLVSLFSFYLMYLGAPKLKNVPKQQDKLLPFIIILAVIWLVLIYLDFRISFEVSFRTLLGSFRRGF